MRTRRHHPSGTGDTGLTSVPGEGGGKDSEGTAECPACGGVWFALIRDRDLLGGITLTTDGRVTGYAGDLHCMRCDRVLGDATPPKLTVIRGW